MMPIWMLTIFLLALLALVVVAFLLAYAARMQWVRRQNHVQPLQMYWSGHITAGHEARRETWLEEDLEVEDKEKDFHIKASIPPFNVKTGRPPDYVAGVDLPAFGPNISRAVMEIFASDAIREVARQLNVPIAKVELSAFVQKKMKKVHEMIKYAREDPKIEASVEAINKMEDFVKEFENLNPNDIKDYDAWSEFMHKHVKPGWENRIHFDVLLDNFGFEKAAADALRSKEIEDDGQTKTLELYACRWLSKAFTGYAPDGALVDVVNLAWAMSGRPIPMENGKINLTDIQIAEEITRVHQKITDKRMFDLWIPSKFVMDAEVDDNLCWIWLESIHRAQGTKLQVLVQLPQDSELDDVAESMGKVDGCTVWRDPDSRNSEPVKKAYGGDWKKSPRDQGLRPGRSGEDIEPLLPRDSQRAERSGLRDDHIAWLRQLLKSPMQFVGEDGGWYAKVQWPLLAVALIDERVLNLQRKTEREEKDGSVKQGWCLGPVIPRIVWAPVVYALLALIFVYIGASAIELKGSEPRHPHWWRCLVIIFILGMCLGEITIARYSAMWYRIRAGSWKCLPVTVMRYLLELCGCKLSECMAFAIWFAYLYALAAVRLFAFFQGNTFLGAILFLPQRNELQCIWENVMKESILLPQFHISLSIWFILFAEAVHFLYGFAYSCPRRHGHSCSEEVGVQHQRWVDQPAECWKNWGRHFEQGVSGEVKERREIETKEDFDSCMERYKRKGGIAVVHLEDGREKVIQVDNSHYEKEYKTVTYIINRHAYTCWLGVEVSSSRVVDIIGEACSLSFLMEMTDLEFFNGFKAAKGAIEDVKNVDISSLRGAKLLKKAAVDVRNHLQGAHTSLRASFSRIIFDICFSGLQTHLQVTFFNVLRLLIDLKTIPVSLWLGIFSQFVTLILLFLKMFKIVFYAWEVQGTVNDYDSVIKPDVNDLPDMACIVKTIEASVRKINHLWYLNILAMFIFVLVIFIWLVPKFIMETFVCDKHMWDFAPSVRVEDGCVQDPVGTCSREK